VGGITYSTYCSLTPTFQLLRFTYLDEFHYALPRLLILWRTGWLLDAFFDALQRRIIFKLDLQVQSCFILAMPYLQTSHIYTRLRDTLPSTPISTPISAVFSWNRGDSSTTKGDPRKSVKWIDVRN
jgi:hypothetical protein